MIRRTTRMMMLALMAFTLVTGTLTVQSMSCCQHSMQSPCQDSEKQCTQSYCAACFAPVLQVDNAGEHVAPIFVQPPALAYQGFTISNTTLVMERPPKLLG